MQFSITRGLFPLLLLLPIAPWSHAAVLATVQKQFRSNGGLAQPIDPSLGFRFTLAAGLPTIPPPHPLPNELYNAYTWSATDLGRTVTITPADDPDFAGFAGILTDGQPGTVYTGQYYSTSPPTIVVQAGTGQDEGGFLGHTAGDPVDLVGFDITAISERLDAVSVSVVPPAPGGSLYTFTATGTMTYTIEGDAVPEPDFAALVGLCGVTLTRRVFRHRHKRAAKRNGT